MPFIYRAECNRCDYQDEVRWPPWACYQWPSGSTLEIAQRWVWCNACRSVRVAEALTDLERIERLQAIPIIADAYDENRKVWTAGEVEAALEYARYPRLTNLYDQLTYWKRWDVRQSIVFFGTLKLHREWRLARTSAARCLTCGGDDFLSIPADHDGEPGSFVHSECGGDVSLRMGGKVNAKRLLWTTEGQYIGAG